MGAEAYFIDRIENELYHSVVSEEERGFDQSILYGKDTTVDQILDAAKRFPMMSEYQLVIVREAQELSRVIDKLVLVSSAKLGSNAMGKINNHLFTCGLVPLDLS